MENSNAEIRLDTLKARRDECQAKVGAIRARIEENRKSLEAARERVNGVTKEIAAAEVPGPDLKRRWNKLRDEAVFFETVLGELEGTLLPKAEEALKVVYIELEKTYISAMKPRRERAVEEFKRLAGLMEDVQRGWDEEIVRSMKEHGINGIKPLSTLMVKWEGVFPPTQINPGIMASSMQNRKRSQWTRPGDPGQTRKEEESDD